MIETCIAGGASESWVRSALKNALPIPFGVGVCAAENADALFAEESSSLGPVTDNRLAEFAAGRTAARQALRSLGGEPAPILRRKDRSPVWPNGFVGSISHSAGMAIAAVASQDHVRTIGLDIELVDAVTGELEYEILSPRERSRLAEFPSVRRPHCATIAFCAKEAFYKAQFAITGRWVGFSDVEVEWNEDKGTFVVLTLVPILSGRGSLTSFQGRFVCGPVFTIATLALPVGYPGLLGSNSHV